MIPALVVASAWTVGAATVTAIDSHETGLRTELTGAGVHPGPGDPEATFPFWVGVTPARGQLMYFYTIEGIDDHTSAHIHAGAAGETGPVILTLGRAPAGIETVGSAPGGLDPDLLQDMADHPANYYVDVHSAEFPDGAVRGQLEPAHTLMATWASGVAVVPGPGHPEIAGVAHVRVDPEFGEACLGIEDELAGLLPITAATIHEAPPGVAGPPVVTLPPAAASGSGTQCVTGQDPAVLRAIADQPSAFYLSLATSEFPDGAVRGQLQYGNSAAPPPGACPATLGIECLLAPGTYKFDGFATDLNYSTTTSLLTVFLADADDPDIGALGFRDPELGGELNLFVFDGQAHSDPCEWSPVPIGDDPADLMAWLTNHPYLDTTDPVAVEYGGVAGLQVDAVALDAGCVLPWVNLFQFNPGIGGHNGAQEVGTILRIAAQKVGEQTIVLLTRDFSALELSAARVQGGETFVNEAQEIVDSLVWDVAASAPSGSSPPSPQLPNTALPPGS